jgi:DNA polymerase-1
MLVPYAQQPSRAFNHNSYMLNGDEQDNSKRKKKCLFIDGTPLVIRAYHGTKTKLTTSTGIPTNAVYTYIKSLLSILQGKNGYSEFDYIGVFFDYGKPSFRASIDSNYKGTRLALASDLKVQIPIAKKATELLGIQIIEKEGYESDDLISTFVTLAEKEGCEVVIYGFDKDFIQLITDNVSILDPKTNILIRREDVEKRYSVPPEKFIFYQSLVGDSVDNIKGVPGIGPKKAAKLVIEFENVAHMLSNLDRIAEKSTRKKIEENEQSLIQSERLVTLDRHVELEMKLESLDARKINFDFKSNQDFMKFLQSYSFNSIINQLQKTTAPSKTKKTSSKSNVLDQKATLSDALKIYSEDTALGKSLRVAVYDIVENDEMLENWIKTIKEKRFVCFSTQLSVVKMHENNLVGIALSVDPKKACYVPLLHNDKDIDFSTSQKMLASHPWFQKLSREVFENNEVKKIAHNVKEHIKRLYPYGTKINNFDDVMVMSYVLNCGKHDHDFETLMEVILHESPKENLITEKDVLGIGKKKVSFARAPVILVTHFACQYSDYTARMYQHLQPKLEANKRLTRFYLESEKPLVNTLAAIELHGVCVDKTELVKMQQEYADKILKTANLIRQEGGYPPITFDQLNIPTLVDSEDSESSSLNDKADVQGDQDFNINSNRQLGFVIFDKMCIGREFAKRSPKSGEYIVNAEVLQKLASKGHAIADYILQYRAMTKLYSTYIYGLQQHINPYTGRIHTTFQNALTVTGRLSSVSPNLQNIPIRTEEGKMIRKAFIAPKGHVIMKVDYSQVELRILAHIANIDALKEAFRNGKDVHAITASQVFKVPVDQVDKNLRSKAKAINFGIIYGMSEYGLAKRINVEVSEARKFIEQYFKQYPGIQKYMERTKEFCRQHGYVNTLFGRKCWIPEINSSDHSKRGFAERTCINTPIQGTSADITKIAMNRLHNKFQELNLGTKMIIQVHDEIVFEVPLQEKQMIQPIIREIMEGAADQVGFSVPLTVDIDVAQSWLNDQEE